MCLILVPRFWYTLRHEVKRSFVLFRPFFSLPAGTWTHAFPWPSVWLTMQKKKTTFTDPLSVLWADLHPRCLCLFVPCCSCPMMPGEKESLFRPRRSTSSVFQVLEQRSRTHAVAVFISFLPWFSSSVSFFLYRERRSSDGLITRFHSVLPWISLSLVFLCRHQRLENRSNVDIYTTCYPVQV
jgi:hypothetical protein